MIRFVYNHELIHSIKSREKLEKGKSTGRCETARNPNCSSSLESCCKPEFTETQKLGQPTRSINSSASPLLYTTKTNKTWLLTNAQLSSALDITESRLGRGWKSARRRCWCDDGRISVARALFTHSPPSTVPILTSEFVIADLRIFSRFGEYDTM